MQRKNSTGISRTWGTTASGWSNSSLQICLGIFVIAVVVLVVIPALSILSFANFLWIGLLKAWRLATWCASGLLIRLRRSARG